MQQHLNRLELKRKCISLCIEDRHACQDAMLWENRSVPGTLSPDRRGTRYLRSLYLKVIFKLRVRK